MLCLGTAIVAPSQAKAQVFVGISVRLAPPPLPIYDQPPIPAPDYLWTPGYWAWDPDVADYYWVPGTWVQPPQAGVLWTPGYWGWQNDAYAWNEGYWGPQIGFYGGIDYGFGYIGHGYEGGYWNGPNFFYNRAVNNITDVSITTVYVKQVTEVRTQVSFNGGAGGVTAQPTAQEEAAARAPHVAVTPEQLQQRHVAAGDPDLRASHNHGVPPVAATARAGVLTGAGVVHTGRSPAPAHELTAAKGPKLGAATPQPKSPTASGASSDHRDVSSAPPKVSAKAPPPPKAEKAPPPKPREKAPKPDDKGDKPRD